jgi:hypothetical protein
MPGFQDIRKKYRRRSGENAGGTRTHVRGSGGDLLARVEHELSDAVGGTAVTHCMVGTTPTSTGIRAVGTGSSGDCSGARAHRARTHVQHRAT